VKRINSMVKYELRKALCSKYDGRCAYCRRVIGMSGTVDYYLPEALGGSNARENLRWCCVDCNQEKGAMHPREWEQRIPERDEPKTKAQRRVELLRSIAQAKRPTSRHSEEAETA
jgi:5-methylcytosine-specific restriction endonuclease McrA